jgi:hypothetical protein
LTHPETLAQDWTFSQPEPEHLVFNALTGAAMTIASIETVAVVGRLICWSIILLGLVRIGKHLGAGRIPVTIGIALWVASGQALVGGEWIFAGLESKVVAYCFGIHAIERAVKEKPGISGLFTGIAFLFHPAVGLQLGVGIAAGLLMVRTSVPNLLRWAVPAAAAALPEVVLLVLASGSAGTGPEEWRFIGTTVMPFHFDAFTFPRREMLSLLVLSLFVLSSLWRPSSDRATVLSAGFLAGLLVILVAGLIARALGRFDLLAITPFRTAPLFAPILFFFHLAARWRQGELAGSRPLLSGLALVGILGLPTPLVKAVHSVQTTFRGEAREDPGLGAAMDWIGSNTDPASTAILPPWRKDAYFRARRAQIASWEAVRYSDTREWRRRIETMVGRLPVGRLLWYDDLKPRYYALGEADVRRLAREFGAGFFLSRSGYDFPVAFESGGFAVYDLGGP